MNDTKNEFKKKDGEKEQRSLVRVQYYTMHQFQIILVNYPLNKTQTKKIIPSRKGHSKSKSDQSYSHPCHPCM